MTFSALRPLLPVLVLSLLLPACSGGYRSRVLDSPATAGLKGHQKPYVINGQLYRPLLDAEGFVEQGLASWYGADFHGRPTSNGETYDMYAMTAAHKTLPMGTWVRVVNVDNGREAVVQINDRGPFVAGRVIDLSYTAARELSVVGPGTVPVRIEALGFRELDAAGRVVYRPARYAAGPFAVQIGSFAVADNAQRLAQDMRLRHGWADIATGYVRGTLFHRVRVGKYPSLDEARSAMGQFARSGYANCYIVAVD